jgi:hypothetical protein
MSKVIDIMNNTQTFDVKEVRKLLILACITVAIISGSGGYFLGTNSQQAEYNAVMLAKEKEAAKVQAEKKAEDERMFKSLKQNKWTIEGDEQGY